MTGITPADLSARLNVENDDSFILDVRPEAEFDDWHVPGSENIDISEELRSDPNAARRVLSTIPEKEVILANMAGAASEKAAEHLHELGYEVKTLGCHRS